MAKKYWLVKTEEDVYPITQLKSDKRTLWDGVRNYQARNYLKEMQVGDLVFVYHSNAKVPGIVGTAEVEKRAVADPLQFLKSSDYFDEKATKESPRWFSPTLKFKTIFKERISLDVLKKAENFSKSPLVGKGNRLSVIPISEEEAAFLLSY